MTGMRCLPPYEQSIVCRAQQFGLAAASPTPACLHQDLGPVVSLYSGRHEFWLFPDHWADLRGQLEMISPPAKDLGFNNGIRVLNHGRRAA